MHALSFQLGVESYAFNGGGNFLVALLSQYRDRRFKLVTAERVVDVFDSSRVFGEDADKYGAQARCEAGKAGAWSMGVIVVPGFGVALRVPGLSGTGGIWDAAGCRCRTTRRRDPARPRRLIASAVALVFVLPPGCG